MSLRIFSLAIALLSFSQISDAADYRPLSADDRAATEDAFAISIYNPQFIAAADAGKAQEMKTILVANGAPADLVLTAESPIIESTDASQGPVEHVINGPCLYAYVLLYSPYPTPGWYWKKVCALVIDSKGAITYNIIL
jgi:hypothetical protein